MTSVVRKNEEMGIDQNFELHDRYWEENSNTKTIFIIIIIFSFENTRSMNERVKYLLCFQNLAQI